MSCRGARVAGRGAGRSYPALADRLAHESGWSVVVPALRGAAGSDGDFSATGWLEDLRFVLDGSLGADALAWCVGFGLGGALGLRLAADDPRVAAVACLGTPADPRGGEDADRLVEVCRLSGVISHLDFPTDVDAWAAELDVVRPLDAAASLDGRPLLVVNGSDDVEVPTAAAWALADAARTTDATGNVDFRLVPGAGHGLWADPRVIATLIGWLERQR